LAAAQHLLDDLNAEQREAVLHGEGPLLVVAGAGSGKTRVITRRVAWLLHEGVPPETVTALTFTNKAAREMRERIERLVPARDLWVSTFHGFCARVLRRYGERLGYTPGFSIYDTDDRSAMLRAVLKDLHLEDLRWQDVGQALSRSKNGMGRSEGSRFVAERITKAMQVYEERMRAQNALDFDDLLSRSVELLETDPVVLERMRERCTWLLVDEYQDTNGVQERLLRLLAPPRRNLCATGDPDQSIYRWRGATVRNILGFESEFPGARVVTLDRNYRSTRRILAAANAVIRNNLDRRPKDLRTDNPEGASIREIACLDEAGAARAVAGEIGKAIASGASPKEFAVFYRVNAQSRGLERAMAESGVPYRLIGAVEFFQRREVKDLLAYARAARNPRDAVAFARVFNVPPRGLGDRTQERFFESARLLGLSPRDALRSPEASSPLPKLAPLRALYERIDALPAGDPAAFLEGVADLSGYRKFVEEEQERLENVNELINAAAEYALREPHGGIDGFLQENALVSDQDDYDADREAATLMTIHSAKGLEFQRVFIAGLEEESFPHALSLGDAEELEEERRLFYVAVTRAREELVLVHSRSRLRYGAPTPARVSRFVREIPAELRELDDRAADPFEVREEEPAFDLDGGTSGRSSPFRVGDRVRHDHFGAGRVAAVRFSGPATRITVDFDQRGRRELALEYARLTRL